MNGFENTCLSSMSVIYGYFFLLALPKTESFYSANLKQYRFNKYLVISFIVAISYISAIIINFIFIVNSIY